MASASNNDSQHSILNDTDIRASRPSGTADHHTPPASRPPPSFRACIACRQMKMKCEGVEEPPCIRCRKVGRECIPQTSTRKVARTSRAPTKQYSERQLSQPIPNVYETPSKAIHQPDSFVSRSPVNVRPSLGGSSLGPPIEPPHHVQPLARDGDNTVRTIHNGFLAELPSIYSTPPIDTVTEANSGAASPHLTGSLSAVRKRKRHSTSTPDMQNMLTPAQSYRNEDGLAMNRRDMHDMISLFYQRHAPYIPVLRAEEFQDLDYIIDHEPRFAYAMCYVTARYLPGGKEIREALLPEVCRIPTEVYTAKLGTHHDDDMCLFKALVVLYSYADLTPPSQAARSTGKENLLYWSLKSASEMYAFRLSLHRSIQEVKLDLASNTSNIYNTKSWQRYTYWLFLYNMSHYCSLVTGTPPTMRVDLSIRAVSGLLDQLGRHPEYPSNLFGAVELFLIWEQSSTAHPQLGEWWCLPDPTERVDENLTESLLNETDRAIDEWYSKWWPHISTDPRGPFLDYHGRFTRFCLASYAIKCLRISPEGPTQLQRSQIQRCVACANHVLEFPLTRGPIEKDNLRYVDDAACIIVSFCCVFILSACQAFPSVIPNISECLDNITDAGNLMVELSINADHKPHFQGTFLLKRVETLRAAMQMSRLHEHQESNVEEPSDARYSPNNESSKLMLEGFDQLFHEDGLFGLEPIWDFSMLFPGS